MKPGFMVRTTVLFFFLPFASQAQTSTGFTDPHDITALMAYRLPDWGYHSSRLGFQFYAANNDQDIRNQHASQFDESLQSTWYRESEKTTWRADINQTGNWRWSEIDTDTTKARASGARGGLDLNGMTRRYLSGDLYAVGFVGAQGVYDEDRQSFRDNRVVHVDRSFSGFVQLGAGLGRRRDVTPLVEAARIGERLRALGRPPLSFDQVERVADVLARAGGYEAVFDRPDRRFWRDGFEPLLGAGGPLSPYEVLYLREASFEQLGGRREGALIEAGVQHRRNGWSGRGPSWETGPWLNAGWSHNLSLDHQLSVDIASRYSWLRHRRDWPSTDETGTATLTATHLWVVADRIYWRNRLSDVLRYDTVSFPNAPSRLITHAQSVGLDSQMAFYVEDRVSIVPEFTFTWRRLNDSYRQSSSTTETREWELTLGLNYRLGAGLF